MLIEVQGCFGLRLQLFVGIVHEVYLTAAVGLSPVLLQHIHLVSRRKEMLSAGMAQPSRRPWPGIYNFRSTVWPPLQMIRQNNFAVKIGNLAGFQA
jgi:hypothetical protein